MTEELRYSLEQTSLRRSYFQERMASRDGRLDAVSVPRSERCWEEIPRGWVNCPAVGQVVADLFLPFKTPLSSQYDAKIPVGKRFTVEDVFDTVEQQGRRIGLWINVATERFYEKTEVSEQHPTKFKQVTCGDHEECPTAEQTRIFIELCEGYHNDRSDALIGVHSTSGFNRTGFLICAYLVEVLDYSVEDAIPAFAKARPPGIYKSEYLEILRRRYLADTDNHPAVPRLPSWCYEEENGRLDGGVKTIESSNDLERSRNEGVQKRSKKVPRFMEEIPGVVCLQDAARVKAVRKKCSRLCGWKGPTFPGCQPVSLDRTNVNMIAENAYRVGSKADGFRYMLLIDGKDDVYFLGRNSEVLRVEGMHFPYVPGCEPYTGAHLTETLLDGEMVLQRLDAQTTRASFLVFDIVHWMNEDTKRMNFDTRHQRIKSGIMEPRNRLAVQGVLDKNAEPFSIRQMDFYPVKLKDENMAAKFLEEEFRSLLTHKVDGLVFQPYDMAYIPGSCDRVLKWKPPSQCTVDFHLRVENSGESAGTSGKLYVGGRNSPFGELKWSSEYDQLDGKIIECCYDRELQQWIFERLRPDKGTPNHNKTAKDVFKAIQHPLNQDDLLDYIKDSVPYFEDEIQKRQRNTEETSDGVAGIQATYFDKTVDHMDDQRRSASSSNRH